MAYGGYSPNPPEEPLYENAEVIALVAEEALRDQHERTDTLQHGNYHAGSRRPGQDHRNPDQWFTAGASEPFGDRKSNQGLLLKTPVSVAEQAMFSGRDSGYRNAPAQVPHLLASATRMEMVGTKSHVNDSRNFQNVPQENVSVRPKSTLGNSQFRRLTTEHRSSLSTINENPSKIPVLSPRLQASGQCHSSFPVIVPVSSSSLSPSNFTISHHCLFSPSDHHSLLSFPNSSINSPVSGSFPEFSPHSPASLQLNRSSVLSHLDSCSVPGHFPFSFSPTYASDLSQNISRNQQENDGLHESPITPLTPIMQPRPFFSVTGTNAVNYSPNSDAFGSLFSVPGTSHSISPGVTACRGCCLHSRGGPAVASAVLQAPVREAAVSSYRLDSPATSCSSVWPTSAGSRPFISADDFIGSIGKLKRPTSVEFTPESASFLCFVPSERFTYSKMAHRVSTRRRYSSAALSFAAPQDFEALQRAALWTEGQMDYELSQGEDLAACVLAVWLLQHGVLLLGKRDNPLRRHNAVRCLGRYTHGRWCYPDGDLLIIPRTNTSGLRPLRESLRHLRRAMNVVARLPGCFGTRDMPRVEPTPPSPAEEEYYSLTCPGRNVLDCDTSLPSISLYYKPLFSSAYIFLRQPKTRFVVEVLQYTFVVFMHLVDAALRNKIYGIAMYLSQHLRLVLLYLERLLPQADIQRYYTFTMAHWLIGRAHYYGFRYCPNSTIRSYYSAIRAEYSKWTADFYSSLEKEFLSASAETFFRFPGTSDRFLRLSYESYRKVALPSRWKRSLCQQKTSVILGCNIALLDFADSLMVKAKNYSFRKKRTELDDIRNDLERIDKSSLKREQLILLCILQAKCSVYLALWEQSYFANWKPNSALRDTEDYSYEYLLQLSDKLANLTTDRYNESPTKPLKWSAEVARAGFDGDRWSDRRRSPTCHVVRRAASVISRATSFIKSPVSYWNKRASFEFSSPEQRSTAKHSSFSAVVSLSASFSGIPSGHRAIEEIFPERKEKTKSDSDILLLDSDNSVQDSGFVRSDSLLLKSRSELSKTEAEFSQSLDGSSLSPTQLLSASEPKLLPTGPTLTPTGPTPSPSEQTPSLSGCSPLPAPSGKTSLSCGPVTSSKPMSSPTEQQPSLDNATSSEKLLNILKLTPVTEPLSLKLKSTSLKLEPTSSKFQPTSSNSSLTFSRSGLTIPKSKQTPSKSVFISSEIEMKSLKFGLQLSKPSLCQSETLLYVGSQSAVKKADSPSEQTLSFYGSAPSLSKPALSDYRQTPRSCENMQTKSDCVQKKSPFGPVQIPSRLAKPSRGHAKTNVLYNSPSGVVPSHLESSLLKSCVPLNDYQYKMEKSISHSPNAGSLELEAKTSPIKLTRSSLSQVESLRPVAGASNSEAGHSRPETGPPHSYTSSFRPEAVMTPHDHSSLQSAIEISNKEPRSLLLSVATIPLPQAHHVSACNFYMEAFETLNCSACQPLTPQSRRLAGKIATTAFFQFVMYEVMAQEYEGNPSSLLHVTELFEKYARLWFTEDGDRAAMVDGVSSEDKNIFHELLTMLYLGGTLLHHQLYRSTGIPSHLTSATYCFGVVRVYLPRSSVRRKLLRTALQYPVFMEESLLRCRLSLSRIPDRCVTVLRCYCRTLPLLWELCDSAGLLGRRVGENEMRLGSVDFPFSQHNMQTVPDSKINLNVIEAVTEYMKSENTIDVSDGISCPCPQRYVYAPDPVPYDPTIPDPPQRRTSLLPCRYGVPPPRLPPVSGDDDCPRKPCLLEDYYDVEEEALEPFSLDHFTYKYDSALSLLCRSEQAERERQEWQLQHGSEEESESFMLKKTLKDCVNRITRIVEMLLEDTEKRMETHRNNEDAELNRSGGDGRRDEYRSPEVCVSACTSRGPNTGGFTTPARAFVALLRQALSLLQGNERTYLMRLVAGLGCIDSLLNEKHLKELLGDQMPRVEEQQCMWMDELTG